MKSLDAYLLMYKYKFRFKKLRGTSNSKIFINYLITKTSTQT